MNEMLNKITHCDCMEAMQALPEKSIDFVFADPPYGIGKAEWDTEYPAFNFEAQIKRLSKAGFAITPGTRHISTCINRLGDEYKGLHVARNLNGMTFNAAGFENCIIAVLGGDIIRGMQFFEFTVDGDKPNHPSPKPINYMLGLLSRFTKPGDLVLDPFSGSGTTAIACHRLERRFICFELSAEHYADSVKRLEEEQSQCVMDLGSPAQHLTTTGRAASQLPLFAQTPCLKNINRSGKALRPA